ncbi:integrase [Ammoniphilus sp. CFH 90114]|nr:integrase [Ammoniphilus sp. CFH 90114]
MSDKRIGKRVKFDRTEKTGSNLDELFQYFYEAKISEGVSERTLETYRENYRFFVDYLEMRFIPPEVSKITPEVLRDYMTWMLTKKIRFDGHEHKSEAEKTVGLSPVTVNTRTKILRTMFRFLLKEGLIQKNPWETVAKVEEHHTEIKVMTATQLKLLLGAPNQRSYAGFRDYVLMTCLIDGFFRINEALSLRVEDIDFDLELAEVRAEVAKTRRSRFVPLSRKTLKLIKELIQECKEFNSEYIFNTNYGEKLDANHFRHRLKEYAEQVGLNIRVHPHLFRHTSATIFLEQGGEIRHLAKILGHADLRMVMKYTHLSNTSIKSQHEQFSPMNQVFNNLNRSRKILR